MQCFSLCKVTKYSVILQMFLQKYVTLTLLVKNIAWKSQKI